jgi:hypothetical protein
MRGTPVLATEPEGGLPVGDPSDKIGEWVADNLADIKAYIDGEPFQRMLAELRAMSVEEREVFVRRILLNAGELADRGLTPPPGITVQRSEFHDQRPTLFCVVRHLPDASPLWRRVTFTFDHQLPT